LISLGISWASIICHVPFALSQASVQAHLRFITLPVAAVQAC
jgi:hypothetical protein